MNSVMKKDEHNKEFQRVRQLQLLAIKVSHLAVRAKALLKTTNSSALSEGLIAVGLCKQGKDQIAAACQNMGIAVDMLPELITSNASEMNKKLHIAAAVVVEALQKTLNVPATAVKPGVESFVEEMLMIAAIVVSRAEEHVNEGERIANRELRTRDNRTKEMLPQARTQSKTPRSLFAVSD